MSLEWPIAYLKPGKITRHISPRTTAGVVTASGFVQRVSVPAHLWRIEYSNITIATAEQIRVWDTYAALLDGGAVPIIVPLVGEAYAVAPDGTFSGTGAAGDTVVTITRASAIAPGYHFTLGEHLYRVAALLGTVGDDYDLNIRPPLRHGIVDGATASFTAPVCKVRLTTDDEMALEISAGGIAVGNVKFIEDPEITA